MRRIRTVLTGTAVAVLLITALAACASGSAGSGSSGNGGDPAAAAVTAPSPGTPVPAGTTLRVADQVGQLETPLALSGAAKGIPYKVTYSSFMGAPAVFQAFAAGAVDLAEVGDAGIIAPQQAGEKFEVIAAERSPNEGYGLVLGKGQDITSPAGLKGKSIGYAADTASETFILRLLASAGLSLKDVNLVNIPSTSAVTALKSGQVDANVSVEPLISEYVAANPGTKVLWAPGVYPATEYIVATQQALADPAKAAAISDYLQRLVKAQDWVAAHWATYTADYDGSVYKVPAALTPQILAQTKPETFLPVSSSVISNQQEIANLFTQAGTLPGHLDVSPAFTTAFNKTVEAAG